MMYLFVDLSIRALHLGQLECVAVYKMNFYGIGVKYL